MVANMKRARAIGNEIAEQERQQHVFAKNDLLEFQKQLLDELAGMGFDDPDQAIDGGDAVEYLGKLYQDLLQMVAKKDLT
jgi:hypothetical protein